MLSKLPRACVVLILVSLVAMTAYAGGWATVTVKNMPEYFVVGKPADVTFLVRQHGVSPLAGLSVSIRATAPGGLETRVAGKPVPSAPSGEYMAALRLPAPGKWTIRIETGWPETSPLLPVVAIQEGERVPSPLSQVERGERLFVSKACITCHVNKELSAETLLEAGPELTGRTFPAEYLRKFLKDPAAMLGRPSTQVGEMPNPQLTAQEIEALVAFVNRERPRVVSTVR